MVVVPAIDHDDFRARLRSNLTNALLLITLFPFFSWISLGKTGNREGHSPGAHKDKTTQTTCCLVVMADGLVDFPRLSTLNLSGGIEDWRENIKSWWRPDQREERAIKKDNTDHVLSRGSGRGLQKTFHLQLAKVSPRCMDFSHLHPSTSVSTIRHQVSAT